jgi:FkbM family methyltransferase
MNYYYCLPFVDPANTKFIVELGARDCEDSVALASYFQCPVLAFECNPEAIQRCRLRLMAAPAEAQVTLVEQAVCPFTGTTQFHSLSSGAYENIGASSLFSHCDSELTSLMKPITVPCTRLGTYLEDHSLPTPDLLCMDIQGGELGALQSLGERLRDCRVIATEVSLTSSYTGGATFSALYSYLLENGFNLEYYPLEPNTIAMAMNGEAFGPGDFDVVFVRDD